MLALISIAVLALGVSFLAAPSVSQAVTINNVTVTIGTTVFALWTFPVTLNPGETLVLTQNSGYNFDTSDLACGNPASVANCAAASILVHPSVGLDTSKTDSTKVLTVGGKDPQSFPPLGPPGPPVTGTFNEAQPYTSLGLSVGGDYEILVAYADNVHSDACGTGAIGAGLAGNSLCLPSPFAGATHFQGVGTNNAGVTNTQPNHCANAPAPRGSAHL